VIVMGLRKYFSGITDAVKTIGEGMAITASHMLRKPVTLEYADRLPEGVRVQDTLPFRYRGILEVDLEICTACLACERACPIGAIHHTPEFEGADYSLESLVRRFVRAPTIAYEPKKAGETDPVVKPILDRGLRYIAELAKGGES
jgi:formate hydrogenlyase subunit 6/NADH:ubiquinone oxidoreductase subunit I